MPQTRSALTPLRCHSAGPGTRAAAGEHCAASKMPSSPHGAPRSCATTCTTALIALILLHQSCPMRRAACRALSALPAQLVRTRVHNLQRSSVVRASASGGPSAWLAVGESRAGRPGVTPMMMAADRRPRRLMHWHQACVRRACQRHRRAQRGTLLSTSEPVAAPAPPALTTGTPRQRRPEAPVPM
jgi:hypothetical protein